GQGVDLRSASVSGLDLSPTGGNVAPSFTDFAGALGKITSSDPGAADAAKDVLEGTNKGEEEDGLGISFPIFKNPSSILGMMFGRRFDLIPWDFRRREASLGFSQSFGPIIPPIPLFVEIAGQFGVFADFFVGLDTRGIQTKSFFNGFFL